jgi:2',3'-cyclic-nucleotide 2'-phosphodiesterase
MNILYIGDIYGKAGIQTIQKLLPKLRQNRNLDLVIAQGENVSDGRGLLKEDMTALQKAGIDFFTGGNWSIYNKEAWSLLQDPGIPCIRPANYPDGTPGLGWKTAKTAKGKILVISLLGSVVGRDANKETKNPLKTVDEILESNKKEDYAAIVVNLHGDFSSEKVIIGHYLDGRVTAVVGDHWHVPTADARVLPKGTAHITDVGMVGALNSSLGVKLDSVIPRWRDGIVTRNEAEASGPYQFNAVLIKANASGLADSIEQIQQTL